MAWTAATLRTAYPEFIFSSYRWYISDQGFVAEYQYQTPSSTASPLSFTHQICFAKITQQHISTISSQLLDKLVFHLGIIEGLSYWKATCSPRYVLATNSTTNPAPDSHQADLRHQSNQLNQEQLEWWHRLLIQGMGEYFFVNQIDFTAADFVTVSRSGSSSDSKLSSSGSQTIKVQSSEAATDKQPTTTPATSTAHSPNSILIPLGGGKDSLLTLDILKTSLPATQLGTVLISSAHHTPPQPQPAADALASLSQLPGWQVIRTQDPGLLELNSQGYLNGHVPFSASVAWITVLAATLTGYDSVAVSNERSSNEGSVEWLDHTINHQYSKTYDFEQSFQDYTTRWFDPAIPHYFSFLRPLFELQIAGLVTQLATTQELQLFRSCNRGKKTNSWCGDCAKCLFAYLIFAPFIKPPELSDLFGKNMLADITLWPLAQDLLGLTAQKPLECVGTIEESLVASYLTVEHYHQLDQPLPALLAKIQTQVLSQQNQLPERAQQLLTSWNQEHSLPPNLVQLLDGYLQAWLLTKRPLIFLGFGREGISSYRYFKAKQTDSAHSSPPQLLVIDDLPLTELSPEVQALISSDPTITFLTTDQFLQSQSQSQSKSHVPNPSQIAKLDPAQLTRLNPVVIKTPGLPLHHPLTTFLTAAGWRVTSNLELFWQELAQLNAQSGAAPIKIIGVTGTKGKSTTTSLIHHVLTQTGFTSWLGGNIGTPALDLLPDIAAYVKKAQSEGPGESKRKQSSSQPTAWVVLELSCHQLSLLSVSPHVAVVQNIVPEHLDYYPTFAEYKTAKAHITRFQTSADWVIYNDEFATAAEVAALSPGVKKTYSLTGQARSFAHIQDNTLYYRDTPVMPTSAVPLLGEFNLVNVLPAIIMAGELGVPAAKIHSAIASFKPLAHRLELVADHQGVKYYNDSLSTLPDATIAALASFTGQKVILIAGGYDRHLDFTQLGQACVRHPLRALLLFKPTGEFIAQAVEQAASSPIHTNPSTHTQQPTSPPPFPIHFVTTMAETVALANQLAQSGDVVLLSPASASFGEFVDYADRGNQFKTEVLKQTTP